MISYHTVLKSTDDWPKISFYEIESVFKCKHYHRTPKKFKDVERASLANIVM